MRLYSSALVVVGTACLLGVIAAWCATSLWLLWHLLPPAPLRAAFSASQLPQLVAPGEHFLPAELQTLRYVKIAVAKTADATVLVVQPRGVRGYRAWRTRAQAAGWRVETHGLLLRVYQPAAGKLPGSFDAVQGAATALLTPGWPVRPAALADIAPASIPLVTERIQVAATRHHQELRAITLSNGQSIVAAPLLLPRPLADSAVIQVPAAYAASLPRELREGWNGLLAAKFHFSLTTPNFIADIGQFDDVVIALQGEDVALGVRGDDAGFTALATTWVQEEERRTRLITRSFRLPDGTVGQEKLPGEPQPVFTAQAHGGCDAPIEGKTTLWLCRSEALPDSTRGFAVLATSKAAGERTLADGTDYWRLAAGGGLWQQLNGCPGHAISSAGNQHGDLHALLCSLKDITISANQTRAVGAALLAD